MANDWILIEVLGHPEPRIMGIGGKPRKMRKIDDEIRGRNRRHVHEAVEAVLRTKRAHTSASQSGDYRVAAEPFISPLDLVNAINVWVGRFDEEPPEQLPTGAWVWDLEAGTCLASQQTHEIYKIPMDKRLDEISRVQSLYGVTAGAQRQAEVLGTTMSGPPGAVLQEVWQIRRYDDVLRDFSFAGRIATDDEGHRWLHGVTQDITVGESAVAAPLSFTETLVEASLASNAGAYAALVDLELLTAIRWLSAEMPGVQCEMTRNRHRNPAVHDDDKPTARRMAREIRTAPTEGRVRVRTTEGGWMWVDCSATLVEIDAEGSVAALVKIRASAH